MNQVPLAYLITFHTCGSWLHGNSKGSVDRQHNRYGTEFVEADPKRFATALERMGHAAILLDSAQRECVEEAIRGVCHHRGWLLQAVHVRTNHVHVVVAADVKPEKPLGDFKVWATRKLRASGLVPAEGKVWSRHGSTKYLWHQRAVENACRYTIDGQGIKLD